jgi:AraC-like DNA-binding protein/quercetin dioxygenase-like cupin family protein
MSNVLIDPSNERKIVDFRALGFRDLVALGRYSYVAAHRPLSRHTHGDMLEFCLLDAGEQPYLIEGKRYILKGGEVLVTFPHERHGTGHNPENRGRLYWLLVRVPKGHGSFMNLSPTASRELLRTLLSIAPRQFRGARTLKHSLEQIFRACEGNGPLRNIEAQNWAVRFLLDVVACARQRKVERVSPEIQSVLDHMSAHLQDESPLLDEYARMTHLSLSRFKIRFKQEMGLAPGKYLIGRKIERAKELLNSSKMSVTDVAMSLGFATSQHFASTFKRVTGRTPREFRSARPPPRAQR